MDMAHHLIKVNVVANSLSSFEVIFMKIPTIFKKLQEFMLTCNKQQREREGERMFGDEIEMKLYIIIDK